MSEETLLAILIVSGVSLVAFAMITDALVKIFGQC